MKSRYALFSYPICYLYTQSEEKKLSSLALNEESIVVMQRSSYAHHPTSLQLMECAAVESDSNQLAGYQPTSFQKHS
jgi:hypothetical protein